MKRCEWISGREREKRIYFIDSVVSFFASIPCVIDCNFFLDFATTFSSHFDLSHSFNFLLRNTHTHSLFTSSNVFCCYTPFFFHRPFPPFFFLILILAVRLSPRRPFWLTVTFSSSSLCLTHFTLFLAHTQKLKQCCKTATFSLSLPLLLYCQYFVG